MFLHTQSELFCASLLVLVTASCGTDHDERSDGLGVEKSAAVTIPSAHFSRVLRANPSDTQVRSVCELTVTLDAQKPLVITASDLSGPPVSLAWNDTGASNGSLSVSGCGGLYACDLVTRWRGNATNGTASACEIIIDDGQSQIVGSDTGTALHVEAGLTAPVIFNQDVRTGTSPSSITSACVLRQSAELLDAEVTGFKVYLDSTNVLDLPGPTPIGAVLWPEKVLPPVSFGSVFVGREATATRLKHGALRNENLFLGDALRCEGAFYSASSTLAFDVNVTGNPSGNGASLSTAPTGWTCDPAWFGTGNACDCGCGIIDPDCEATCGAICCDAVNGTCDSSCQLTCSAGFENCNGDPSDGCESATPCPVTHQNCIGASCTNTLSGQNLGQTYSNASPLGTPGNNATYTQQMAIDAANAWPVAGSVQTGMTSGCGSYVLKLTSNSCTVWTWQSGSVTGAGNVHYNSLQSMGNYCFCNADATWD